MFGINVKPASKFDVGAHVEWYNSDHDIASMHGQIFSKEYFRTDKQWLYIVTQHSGDRKWYVREDKLSLYVGPPPARPKIILHPATTVPDVRTSSIQSAQDIAKLISFGPRYVVSQEEHEGEITYMRLTDTANGYCYTASITIDREKENPDEPGATEE